MTKKMERTMMVKAMEFIVRQCNDEDCMNPWLMCGVADGDIEYGDFTLDDVNVEDYIEEDTFAELMQEFLKIMKLASYSGGLYCGGVVSK